MPYWRIDAIRNTCSCLPVHLGGGGGFGGEEGVCEVVCEVHLCLISGLYCIHGRAAYVCTYRQYTNSIL